MKALNKKYFATFITCASILLFGALLPIGELWEIFIICTIVWIAFQLFKLRGHRDWKKFAVQLSSLFVVCVIVFGIHQQRACKYREIADLIAIKTITYKEKYGIFPTRLEDIGETQSGRISHLKYHPFVDEPLLYYKNTYLLFDEYIYNFKKKCWIDTSRW